MAIDSRGSNRAGSPPVSGDAEGEADGRPSVSHEPLRVLHGGGTHASVGCGEAGHPIALSPAKELVHGHAEAPRDHIVQRDVYGRDGCGEDTPALEVLAAVHLLPEGADASWVLANQELAVVLNGAPHRKLAPHQARFTPSVKPGVGLDLHDHQVPHRPTRHQRLHVGNLHAWLPIGL